MFWCPFLLAFRESLIMFKDSYEKNNTVSEWIFNKVVDLELWSIVLVFLSINLINSDRFCIIILYCNKCGLWFVIQIGIQSFDTGETNEIVEHSFPLILKIDFAIYFCDKMSQVTSWRFKIHTTAFNGCYYSRCIAIFRQPWIFRTLDFHPTLIRFENLVGVTKENTECIRRSIHFRNCTTLRDLVTTIFHNRFLYRENTMRIATVLFCRAKIFHDKCGYYRVYFNI